ncbi:MAG: hypothetical protein JXA71_02740 [Chitinispirillaceae bacterium]|nr:hypothetical protein [Chitinispirillaceae bacterium]
MADMFLRVSAVFFLLIAAGLCAAATPEQQASYFAGIAVLSARSDLPDSIKAARYRDLERISGMTAAEARTYLAAVRNRPEEWRALYDRIMVLISESPSPRKAPVPGSDTLFPRSRKRR